jgi:hypothetical protein
LSYQPFPAFSFLLSPSLHSLQVSEFSYD